MCNIFRLLHGVLTKGNYDPHRSVDTKDFQMGKFCSKLSRDNKSSDLTVYTWRSHQSFLDLSIILAFIHPRSIRSHLDPDTCIYTLRLLPKSVTVLETSRVLEYTFISLW